MAAGFATAFLAHLGLIAAVNDLQVTSPRQQVSHKSMLFKARPDKSDEAKSKASKPVISCSFYTPEPSLSPILALAYIDLTEPLTEISVRPNLVHFPDITHEQSVLNEPTGLRAHIDATDVEIRPMDPRHSHKAVWFSRGCVFPELPADPACCGE